MKALFLLLAGFPWAQHANADSDAQAIAFNCLNCHAPQSAEPHLPQLDLLSAQTIRQKLLEFKYGQTAATLMPRIAKGYSDAELQAVADYLGQR